MRTGPLEHADCIGGRRQTARPHVFDPPPGPTASRRSTRMQVAVSAVLELPTSQRRRASRAERLVPTTSGILEIGRELRPAAYVELEVPPTPAVAEVLPAERSERLSRFTNVTIAVLAAVILAPVFLLIALAVKLTSRGPIFYSQV